MVIIHQLGMVDLVYNKSGVTGLGASNNTLKLVGHSRFRSGNNVNVNSDTHWRNKGSRTNKAH